MTKLAKLMSENDLTDRALAEMVGAPEPEIWRLRKGPHNRGQKMTAAWARRLALALKVEWSDLLDDDFHGAADTGEAPETKAQKSRPTPARAARVFPREQEALSRDDLRVVHAIIGVCAFSCSPEVHISADAFRNLIQRAIENAACDHADLSTLADRIASLLAANTSGA